MKGNADYSIVETIISAVKPNHRLSTVSYKKPISSIKQRLPYQGDFEFINILSHFAVHGNAFGLGA